MSLFRKTECSRCWGRVNLIPYIEGDDGVGWRASGAIMPFCVGCRKFNKSYQTKQYLAQQLWIHLWWNWRAYNSYYNVEPEPEDR